MPSKTQLPRSARRIPSSQRSPRTQPKLDSGTRLPTGKAAAAPQLLNPQEMLQLQQTTGNRSLSKLLGERPGAPQIQAKLRVSSADDQYEQEADRAAAQAVGATSQASLTDGPIQTKSLGNDGGLRPPANFEGQLQSANQGGAPLPAELQTKFGGRLGADFSQVRLHTGSDSAALNEQIQAQAFTQGPHIHFGAKQYNPGSAAGQSLLAHELTHTIQQGAASGAGQTRHGAQSNKVQRKVMIKRAPIARWFSGHREKTKTARGKSGAGERKVENMMTDARKRYFDSKTEMEGYAKKETDNVGYVAREDAWIRIPKNELLVLGEDHTATTLGHVAQATGSDRFMYEPYTEHPSDNPELDTVMNEREQEKSQEYGIQPGGRSHHAESFYPKALRAIAGIRVQYNFEFSSSAVEDRMLRWALLDAKAATGPAAEILETYQANKALFDQSATELATQGIERTALAAKIKEDQSGELYTKFHEEFVEYANAKIKGEQEAAPAGDRNKFARNWRILGEDYSQDPDAPIMKAEKARDFSMYQHIKKAKANGYHLFGLGELHRGRLASLLRTEGIKHKKMADFITEQKRLHPQ